MGQNSAVEFTSILISVVLVQANLRIAVIIYLMQLHT